MASTMTRLDDLLSYEDKPPSRRRWRLPARIIRTAIFCGIVSALVWEFLRLHGVGVPYVLLLTVIMAGGALYQMLRWLSPPRIPETLRDTQVAPGKEHIRDSDGVFRAVRRWAGRMDWTEDDLARFAQVVQPAIADVVDERLRQRHGIVRSTEPDRARELCGPELWTFITKPVTRRLSPNELAAVVAAMEAL